MAEFERGQAFVDPRATNIQGQKPKFFIALSDANEQDDEIVCFAINTEHNMKSYVEGCNKTKEKYILKPKELSFINSHSAIMLGLPCRYLLKEILDKRIQLKDKANDTLCRQIKNCITFENILPKFAKIIKECFKGSPKKD